MRRSIKEDLLSLAELIDANAPSCENFAEDMGDGTREPLGAMESAPECACEHCVLARLYDRLSEVEKAVTQ